MLPDDFRVRSVDGVADDWPVTYDELLPFYEETDRQFGVSGLGGNPRYPEGAEPPLPPLPLGKVGMEVARAHHRLGWHWWPATNAIASAEYRNQHVCVRRGSCGQGCNEGAKGSTDVTHWPDALAAGARARHRGTGAPHHGRRATAWPPAPTGSTVTAPSTTSAPTWCSSRPTASARPGCCWPPPTTATPTAWPTPRAWSAGG